MFHPECYPPRHSGVTLFLRHPHPHPHFIPEHEMIVAPELGSGFFRQP
jgi:hypothetical protein